MSIYYIIVKLTPVIHQLTCVPAARRPAARHGGKWRGATPDARRSVAPTPSFLRIFAESRADCPSGECRSARSPAAGANRGRGAPRHRRGDLVGATRARRMARPWGAARRLPPAPRAGLATEESDGLFPPRNSPLAEALRYKWRLARADRRWRTRPLHMFDQKTAARNRAREVTLGPSIRRGNSGPGQGRRPNYHRARFIPPRRHSFGNRGPPISRCASRASQI